MSDLVIKEVELMNTQILTKADKYESDGHMKLDGILIHQAKLKGECKLWQKVVAVGPMVRQVKVGDTVVINPLRYIKVEHPEDENSLRGIVTVRNDYSKYALPSLTVNGEEHILIYEQDVDYKLKDYEEK